MLEDKVRCGPPSKITREIADCLKQQLEDDFCSHHDLCELRSNVLQVYAVGLPSVLRLKPLDSDFVKFARHLLLFVHDFAG